MGEATLAAATKLDIGGVVFSPAVTPPGSSKTLFLGGAGVRGLEIDGKFIVFTAIGVYLEETAVPALACKWKGKSAEELAGSVQFFRDIVTGPFEKFTRVAMVLHLTGQQYSDKVVENCVAIWKSQGIYGQAEAAAAERFKEIFQPQNHVPGTAILFTHFPSGALTIAFSEDESIPEAGTAVIESKALSEAVLESIIGEHGVSPAARRSLACRLRQLLDEDPGVEKPKLEQAVMA